MPRAILWKHTHPEGTCRDFHRLIPTRETGKHRGAVACKLCLDWLERVGADENQRALTHRPLTESEHLMTSSAVLQPVVPLADEILSTFNAKREQIVALPSGGKPARTLHEIIVAAIEADRAARPARAHAIADAVVYENYGPEGDIDVFREAEALAVFSADVRDVDSKLLLAAALSTGHLDADGILAMMREASR